MAALLPVNTTTGPAPISHFSQAQVFNRLVYVSGTIAIDPKTNAIVEGTVKERTEQIIRNISAVLEAANSSLKRIIKVNVYLTTMESFGLMNEGYATFFSEPFPARICVAVVGLPMGTDVEIDCVAAQH
ncbi:RutC family protein [Cladobotryum mycophilum]|uniref:RutC family protein n=1 Tax=Cladobotryum mycophilum TaxID=491253 RepID=A0ABR0S8A4_9HYPO